MTSLAKMEIWSIYLSIYQWFRIKSDSIKKKDDESMENQIDVFILIEYVILVKHANLIFQTVISLISTYKVSVCSCNIYIYIYIYIWSFEFLFKM